MRTTQSRFVSLRNLEERPVRDSEGDLVGRVDDVVIDTHSGRISYLRLFLPGTGDDFEGWISVPWSVLRVRVDSGAAIEVAVRAEVLRKLARRPSGDESGDGDESARKPPGKR